VYSLHVQNASKISGYGARNAKGFNLRLRFAVAVGNRAMAGEAVRTTAGGEKHSAGNGKLYTN